MGNKALWIGTIATFLCGVLVAIPVFWLLNDFVIVKWIAMGIITFFTIPAVYASYVFSPWLPTSTKDLERIKNIAQLQKQQKFYDLGCGDGRVVVYLSQNTEAMCIGIEISPFHFLLAKLRQLFFKKPNLQICLGNLFEQKLDDANVVYVWSCPRTLKGKFKKKLEQDLKKGAKVISYEYPIEGWEETFIDRPYEKDMCIYVYHI